MSPWVGEDVDRGPACGAGDEAGFTYMAAEYRDVDGIGVPGAKPNPIGLRREGLADAEGDYRWLDSGQRLAVTHKETNTKLRVLSSSGKRAMGLSQFSTIYADEPGAWEVRRGCVMWDALRQSLGKRPGQRLLLIGTRAPSEDGSWWPSLLDGGSGPGTHVTVLTAPEGEPWDAWSTIRRVNPLVLHNPSLRKTILR